MEVKLPALLGSYDRQTDRPTNQPSDNSSQINKHKSAPRSNRHTVTVTDDGRTDKVTFRGCSATGGRIDILFFREVASQLKTHMYFYSNWSIFMISKNCLFRNFWYISLWVYSVCNPLTIFMWEGEYRIINMWAVQESLLKTPQL